MFNAAKYLTALAELVTAVSTYLSIALVVAVTALSVLTREDARPPVRASASVTSSPILVAARRRSREREERARKKPEPVRKNSAIAREEKPKEAIPVPSSDAKKPEAAEAEPPKPDVWSQEEIIAGLHACLRRLAPIAADVEVEPPMKHEQCGDPAPVALRRIYSDAGKVEFTPPALLNCAMVASLYTWVEETLQPTAEELLGSPIVRLWHASGYSCRKRNGSRSGSAKLSEHARANAIDIGGFVTADGRTIEVGKFWGPTARDVRQAEMVAAGRAKENAAAKKEDSKPQPAKAEPGPTRQHSAIAARSRDLKKSRNAAPVMTTEPHKLGAGHDRDEENDDHDDQGDRREDKGDAKSDVAALVAERDKAAASAEGAFLRRLHKGACGTFGTVLGPEANAAHRDHFHFDLAERRRNAFCE
jgi:hypothetical protein